MLATGANAADAAGYIQAQTGLTLSPLADYSGPTAPQLQAALSHASRCRRRRCLPARSRRTGQPDLSGATVTQADIDKAADDALRGECQRSPRCSPIRQ